MSVFFRTRLAIATMLCAFGLILTAVAQEQEVTNNAKQSTPSPTSSVLTVKIAEQFLADKYSVVLDKFKTIEDAAAEALSKHEGVLILAGLTELSDAQAESLSKHRGALDLSGVTELSDAAAESLSKHEGERLHLSGLTELSDAQAESLSKHEGKWLYLWGVTELSDTQAESLSAYEGRLYVDYVKQPPSAAKIIRDSRTPDGTRRKK